MALAKQGVHQILPARGTDLYGRAVWTLSRLLDAMLCIFMKVFSLSSSWGLQNSAVYGLCLHLREIANISYHQIFSPWSQRCTALVPPEVEDQCPSLAPQCVANGCLFTNHVLKILHWVLFINPQNDLNNTSSSNLTTHDNCKWWENTCMHIKF